MGSAHFTMKLSQKNGFFDVTDSTLTHLNNNITYKSVAESVNRCISLRELR